MIMLQNVSKVYYPGKIPAVALRNISLEIKEGEFVIVGGVSGSGKSTLLNIIGLMDAPTEGVVTIDTLEINQKKEKSLTKLRRDYLGFIFQNFNLIPTLTVYENVEYPLLRICKDVHARRSLVENSLEEVGLKDFMKRYPNEISGGQQQRVSIARAFAKQPSIVLADEPTANLDSANGSSIVQIMEKMNLEKKVTFVLASHDSEILSMPHRKILLKDGQIIRDSLKGENYEK